jgi:hypothetical protein
LNFLLRPKTGLRCQCSEKKFNINTFTGELLDFGKGKKRFYYEGYLYYKRNDSVTMAASRWCCTSSKTCPAYAYVNKHCYVVKESERYHNHEEIEVEQLEDGTYKKMKTSKPKKDGRQLIPD